MTYITKNLMTNEEIAFQTHYIWTTILHGFIISTIGALLTTQDLLLGAVLVLVGLIYTFLTYLKIRSSKFGVTNKRILIKTGIITTQSIEVMLTKIEGIQIEQSLAAKCLNSGTIIIKGTGTTNYTFTNIHKPFEFRNAINKQISNL